VGNFERLVSGIKARADSWQKHLIRVQDLAIAEIKKKLAQQKDGGKDAFNDQYRSLENTLKILQNAKIRNQMLDWKISEVFDVEKPSKHFLDIASKTTNKGNLADIKSDTGEPFLNKQDRNKHIVDFYKNLYSATPTVGSIEDFLGPDICSHEMIQSSKLTDAEMTELDSELRITELDESLKKSNFKSAPG
jgi:hypothetical protein